MEALEKIKAEDYQNPDEVLLIVEECQAIPDLPLKANWSQLKAQKINVMVGALALAAKNLPDLDSNGNFDLGPRPFANVAPPPESGMPSGVYPDAIQDSQLRARYQSDINRNHEIWAQYNRKRKWQDVYGRVLSQFEMYQKYAFVEQDDKILRAAIVQQIQNPKILNKILIRIAASKAQEE